ncbi:hypothetical protein KAR91_11045 [Candidatus Pacearchaeota archaeon]|nr:hypothetical protein [Candidatus Pacearchaeota archaeon]
MALVKEITLGNLTVCSVDADPSTAGVAAAIGSFALCDVDGCIYSKWGSADTEWGMVPTGNTHYEKLTIDGTALASTLIKTTRDDGKLFVPQQVFAVLRTVSGFTSVPSLSLGTNSTDYDNICAIGAMTTVDAADELIPYAILAPVQAVAANTGIYVKITTAAVATTYDIDVIVMGFYH